MNPKGKQINIYSKELKLIKRKYTQQLNLSDFNNLNFITYLKKNDKQVTIFEVSRLLNPEEFRENKNIYHVYNYFHKHIYTFTNLDKLKRFINQDCNKIYHV